LVAGRITQADLETQFSQLARHAMSLGADTDTWTLVPGTEIGVPGRSPWLIEVGEGHPLVLGYTKREALAALHAMNAFAQVVNE
jgi:hypothetical protein